MGDPWALNFVGFGLGSPKSQDKVLGPVEHVWHGGSHRQDHVLPRHGGPLGPELCGLLPRLTKFSALGPWAREHV